MNNRIDRTPPSRGVRSFFKNRLKLLFLLLFLLLAGSYGYASQLVLAILPQRAEAAGASLSGSSSVQAGNSVTLTLSVDSKILGLTADLNCGDGLTFTNYSCSVSGWSILVNQNHFSVYGTNSASGGIITVTLKVSSSVQGGAALSASFSNIVASDGETDIDVGTASWTGSVAAAPSGDCTLSAIMCGNATLSPAFSSGTTYYTAKVPYSVSKLSLDYNRNDKGQTVNISGNDLAVGVNTVTLKVTSSRSPASRTPTTRPPPMPLCRRWALRVRPSVPPSAAPSTTMWPMCPLRQKR